MMEKTSRTRDMKDLCIILDSLKQWNPLAPNLDFSVWFGEWCDSYRGCKCRQGITGCMTDC